MKTQTFLQRTALFIAAALALGSPAFADDSLLKHGDKSFLEKAAKGNMMEVHMGEMANRKSANTEVKKFADKIITDHTANNVELKTLADMKKTGLPDKNDDSMKSLDAKSGADFDKAWVEAMVKDHKDDIKEYEKQAADAADPDVKAYAAKTLPTLKLHLSIAEGVWDKLGRDK